jgi:pimeloyl-ACP methyl ester carboxylesterase
LIVIAALCLGGTAWAAPVQTGYAPVNGLEILFEIHGTADSARPPLVLLHGGGDTITTSFGRILPELARTRQVIAFEQQGYGHTADIADRPFSFEQSADDTAALLKYLHIDKADLFGFSNGGTIALQVAIRHPEVVRKLVVASALFNRAGADPAFWQFMDNARLENMPRNSRKPTSPSRRSRKTCGCSTTRLRSACATSRTFRRLQSAASRPRRWSSSAMPMSCAPNTQSRRFGFCHTRGSPYCRARSHAPDDAHRVAGADDRRVSRWIGNTLK